MILRQPLPQIRRQQQFLLTVTSNEVLGHTAWSSTRRTAPFTQQPPSAAIVCRGPCSLALRWKRRCRPHVGSPRAERTRARGVSLWSKFEVGEGVLTVEVGAEPRHLTGADTQQIRCPLWCISCDLGGLAPGCLHRFREVIVKTADD